MVCQPQHVSHSHERMGAWAEELLAHSLLSKIIDNSHVTLNFTAPDEQRLCPCVSVVFGHNLRYIWLLSVTETMLRLFYDFKSTAL